MSLYSKIILRKRVYLSSVKSLNFSEKSLFGHDTDSRRLSFKINVVPKGLGTTAPKTRFTMGTTLIPFLNSHSFFPHVEIDASHVPIKG